MRQVEEYFIRQFTDDWPILHLGFKVVDIRIKEMIIAGHFGPEKMYSFNIGVAITKTGTYSHETMKTVIKIIENRINNKYKPHVEVQHNNFLNGDLVLLSRMNLENWFALKSNGDLFE